MDDNDDSDRTSKVRTNANSIRQIPKIKLQIQILISLWASIDMCHHYVKKTNHTAKLFICVVSSTLLELILAGVQSQEMVVLGEWTAIPKETDGLCDFLHSLCMIPT